MTTNNKAKRVSSPLIKKILSETPPIRKKQIQNRIDDLYDQAYQGYGLKPPPRLPMPKVPEVKEKPGFFSGMFGGSPAPKTVSFDQLPK
jgi:hypothetical protein